MGGVLADSFFVTANYLEACLWGAISASFIVYAIARRGGATCLIAAVALFFFGVSDVIETRTGAWWRPWWLLVWKGGCLAVFLALPLNLRKARREASSRPSGSPNQA